MAKDKKVNGSTEGLRNALLERISALYDMAMAPGEFASHELISELCALTGEIRREISVYIARDGSIADVSIGSGAKVEMPSMRLVRNEDRLCGVRCLHTHPGGDGRLSGVDMGTLRSMKLDSMAAVGVSESGEATTLYAAFLGDMAGEEREVLVAGPLRPYRLPQRLLLDEIRISDDRFRSATRETGEMRSERAILVGLENSEPYDTLEELRELAETAGATVVGRSIQKRKSMDSATYIGSGKAEELSLLASETEADIFIFDDELSAMQLKNLENILSTPVIDRTTLILDIFARRAESREGRLQVELAQLKYGLTRLAGQGNALSRLGGGIGTRGPGEKKLEIDRRRIRRRIFELGEEIDEIARQRELRRSRRERNPIPLVALVGYTNAGKSTLLNALTGAGVLAEDKLFATLDPVVRQVTLPHGTDVLFSDTVGFINKLPHDLVDAFRSTLEEVSRADLILHIVDLSCPHHTRQMAVVEDVLSSLGAGGTARIVVYNKADRCGGVASMPKSGDNAYISAATGDGLDALIDRVESALSSGLEEISVTVPYEKYEAMTLLRSDSRILSEEHGETGTTVKALADKVTAGKLRKLLGGK